MLKEFVCFCIDHWEIFIIMLVIFGVAFLLFLLTLFGAGRYFKRIEAPKSVVRNLSVWIFLFYLEVAVITSLSLVTIEMDFLTDIYRVVVVAIILTIMMGLISLAHSYYKHKSNQLMAGVANDRQARNQITQAILVYRLTIIAIVILAMGAIFIVFPYIRSVGIGIFSSAGILGIAVGFAAKPVLLDLVVGLQVTFTKVLKIGDRVQINNYLGTIEAMHLTRIVLKTWDNRRILIPISKAMESPFESYDLTDQPLIGSAMIYVDYIFPVDELRKKFEEIVTASPLHVGDVKKVVVTDTRSDCMEIRCTMSARTFVDLFLLRCHVREKLIQFINENYPLALPIVRNKEYIMSVPENGSIHR